MSASAPRPDRCPGRASSARTSAASAPEPSNPRAAASGSGSVASGLPPRIWRIIAIRSAPSGSNASKPAWLTIARTASGCRMPRTVAVIAPSLNPAISGRSSASASIRAATSSASRSKLIGPPGVPVLPLPRVSGRDHPEVLGQRVHVAGIRDGHAGPDRVGGDHAAVQQHERLALALLEVVDVDAVGVNAPGRATPWCSPWCSWCPPSPVSDRCGQARSGAGGRHRAFA